MRRGLSSIGAVVLCLNCRKPEPDAPPPSVVAVPHASATKLHASASASASRRVDLDRQPTSEAKVPGLLVETGVLGLAARWGYSDLALDTQLTTLRVRVAKHGATLEELASPGAWAVVNGGYFEPDFRPTTWLVDEGVELSPKADRGKGGVLALGAGGIYLGPAGGLGFAPTLALHSFPLVVEAEGKPGIYRDDGRRAARTIACLVGDALHFIVIAAPRGDGPTLFESAAFLREPRPAGFGCRRALNLDGGPSSGVWFSDELHAKQRPPFAKVGYAIAILPR